MRVSSFIRWLFFILVALTFFFFEAALVYRSILLGCLLLLYVSIVGKVDILIIIYIIFAIFYIFFLLINQPDETLRIFSIFYPIFCYFLGSQVGKNVVDSKQLLSVVYIFSFASAFYYIISIGVDIYTNGFLGNGRSINLLLSDDNYAKSATVIGGNFTALIAFLALIFISKNKIKYILTGLMIGYFSLRLGSRTQLLLLFLTIIVGYILSSKILSVTKKAVYLVSSSLAMIYLVYYVLEKTEYAFFFEDRMDSDTHGVGSFGGRTDIWSEAISLLWKKPFGWTPQDMTTAQFAHNLWLDVYKNGGIISFIMFLVFTILVVKKIIISYQFFNNIEMKIFIVSFCLVNLILFNMEPILDGFIFPFSIFLFTVGIIYSFSNSVGVSRKCT